MKNFRVPREKLSMDARLLHYAIVSLQKELDAVDWYRERADDSDDKSRKAKLLRDVREAMGYAAMLMEWLRRNNSDFARTFETFLFYKDGDYRGLRR